MALTKDQIKSLIEMVSTAESDELDCDGCFGQIAEFAELHLAAQELPEAMRAVQHHLEQCLCCRDEFHALLKGLAEADSSE